LDAADLDTSSCHVIQPRDQLDERGLRASRSADHTYDLTALDVEIHILQRQVAALSSIAEINMLEIDISARHFRNRVFCIFHLRNFIQNFRDTICGCLCDHDRSEEHTSELQSRFDLVCRLLLEKKKLTNDYRRPRPNRPRPRGRDGP